MAGFRVELVRSDEQAIAVLRLSGCIGFDNCIEVVREGELKLSSCRQNEQVALDVSGVENAHSVLLSVLLRWLASAEMQKLKMSVTGLSGKMFEVARVSGIETVLPLSYT